ncbi:MAG: hypothetical protein JRG97_02750 [Deltaproteobacteria bacterium]|nr:hypothetical protein [Deltaproteobacteria bacterium]
MAIIGTNFCTIKNLNRKSILQGSKNKPFKMNELGHFEGVGQKLAAILLIQRCTASNAVLKNPIITTLFPFFKLTGTLGSG